jgi:DNA invertase Pin-like site-specific DNA recombinase
MTKRAVIYIRTSTSKQHGEAQEKALDALVENSGYVLVEKIKDIGVSGTRKGRSRKGFTQLMEMVNRRECDVVCVYSVDRIGRKMADVVSLVQELDDKGVGIIIHKNAIDTTTTMGRHIVGFFALVAEIERDFITARVRDGMENARAKGKKIGRPKMSNEKIEQIIEMRRQGKGMNFIAKQLGVGNSQVVRVCKEMTAAA